MMISARLLNLAIGCLFLTLAEWSRGGDDPRFRQYGETSLAFSADGKWIATGGADSKVRIRDGTEGKVLATLSGHDKQVNTVAVSPDGRTIVSGSNDGSIRLWDAERRASRQVLLALKGPVKSVAFAPDGQTMVSGSVDGIARLWDVATGHMTASWNADDKWTDQLIYSPDGQTIASVGSDRVVKFWDAQSHKLRREFEQWTDTSITMAYSPGGSFLAVTSKQDVSLWDAKTGEEKLRLRGYPVNITALAFTREDDCLVVSGLAGPALFSTKTAPNRFAQIRKSFGDYCVAVAVSPDGRRIAQCYLSPLRTDRPGFEIIGLD